MDDYYQEQQEMEALGELHYRAELAMANDRSPERLLKLANANVKRHCDSADRTQFTGLDSRGMVCLRRLPHEEYLSYKKELRKLAKV